LRFVTALEIRYSGGRMSLFNRKESSPEPELSLHPSLEDLVNANHFDRKRLMVPCPTGAQGIQAKERLLVPVSDGGPVVYWSVPSLASLYRGNAKPPADMREYPAEYVPFFYFIEQHVLLLCQTKGDRTDQEMEEIFAALRRRPDGRTVGPNHDYIWQVAALMLGKHVLSEEQYTAIVGRLEQSARAWALKPISRFYAAYLHQNLAK
jgi:hypothetical protein